MKARNLLEQQTARRAIAISKDGKNREAKTEKERAFTFSWCWPHGGRTGVTKSPATQKAQPLKTPQKGRETERTTAADKIDSKQGQVRQAQKVKERQKKVHVLTSGRE